MVCRWHATMPGTGTCRSGRHPYAPNIMVFSELEPQIEKLSREEMLETLAFLKSRLRADTAANRDELSRLHAEMDAGRKVNWDDLKRQLGLS